MLSFIMRLLRSWGGRELASPNDWVKQDQINYNAETQLLTIKLKPQVKIFGVADRNSMDGLLDIGHNIIATSYFDRTKLVVGDIVVYKIYTSLIVHRLIEIREDANGRIYRCRGDNNVSTDQYYLRDEHLKYLVVGIIY